MGTTGTNALVEFLRQYGPIDASDNLYDERIQDEQVRFGVDKPIEVPPPRLTELLENFESAYPHSIILTGTAGDGKTFHCRQLWERLGGSRADWALGKKVVHLRLSASGRTLVIVKDLSELSVKDKESWLPIIARALRGQDPSSVFLVAANDGQLLASWREWAERSSERDISVFRGLERMLIDRKEVDPDDKLHLRLYNLSLLDPSPTFDALLEQVLEHPMWNGCGGCSLFEAHGESRCPIRINRERLRGTVETNPFRRRLSELLRLAAASRMHMPIRHLLLLAVNTLLGDHKPPKPLLTCRTARNRAEQDDIGATNPYANVFGANLPNKRRVQYQVFNALDTFGIGRETENAFDNLLVYGDFGNPERYAHLVANDEYHGEAAYRNVLNRYLEGERDDVSAFTLALAKQRQRLFFSLPANEPDLDPWRLTVYRYAGDFLGFCHALGNNESVQRVEETLVRGLNRTFCGMLIDDTTAVYVASSGGDGRGQIASLLNHELAVRRHRRRVYLRFALPADSLIPQIEVCDPGAGVEPEIVARLSLELTHFEYLMRVADGSLPASFSRQCYEDFLDFKLLLIERLDQLLGSGDDDVSFVCFRAITVNDAGRPEPDEFRIRV